MINPTARTRRSPDGVYATPGAVNQHEGKLPIYVCNTCDLEVVWVTSVRTGRKYLANISHGYHGQRFYIGANVHKCAEVMARRDDADRERERNAEFNYQLHVMDEHELDGHTATPGDRCQFCDKDGLCGLVFDSTAIRDGDPKTGWVTPAVRDGNAFGGPKAGSTRMALELESWAKEALS